MILLPFRLPLHRLSTMALCAAALCAAGAHAQSSVQVTGLMDVYAGSMKMAGDAKRKSVVDSGGMTTS